MHISSEVDHRVNKFAIANRGASFHFPENTLASFRLAMELGADLIGPDVVSTSDRNLVALLSVDLEQTTNVRDVFPNRSWFSPYAGRIGYWSFNFTLNETSHLRVRQRLPNSRTASFDNLLPVPTLLDILRDLNDWNKVQLEQTLLFAGNTQSRLVKGPRKPTNLELAETGLYVELKDYLWQKEEAGIDLVDLMFQNIDKNRVDWDVLMTCFEELDSNTYKVPPLVIQSFDLGSLQYFHEIWQKRASLLTPPEPPLVFLMNQSSCNDEAFWLEVAPDLNKYISAIGPDKHCLVSSNSSVGMTLAQARALKMPIHIWTERPEASYFANPSFDTILDESRYLLYNLGVDGLISESNFDVAGKPERIVGDTGIPPECTNIDRELGTYLGVLLIMIAGLVYLIKTIAGNHDPAYNDEERQPLNDVEQHPVDSDDQDRMEAFVGPANDARGVNGESVKRPPPEAFTNGFFLVSPPDILPNSTPDDDVAREVNVLSPPGVLPNSTPADDDNIMAHEVTERMHNSLSALPDMTPTGEGKKLERSISI